MHELVKEKYQSEWECALPLGASKAEIQGGYLDEEPGYLDYAH